MDTIDFNYFGIPFTIADHDRYPRWTNAKRLTTVQVSDDTWRSEILGNVGVRYGRHSWLRKRVLRAARAANPDRVIPEDASITMPIVLGLEWTASYNEERERLIVQGVPELYMSVGPRREFYVDRRGQRGTLQRLLDGQTFGIGNETLLDDVWEKFSVGDTLEVPDDEDQWGEMIERALRALFEPPVKAPAFPTNWQSYVIEVWRRSDVYPEEFEHITSEAVEVLSALGLEPDEKSVRWDTYPARFACRMDPSTLLDVINDATSEKADKIAAQCADYAEYVATYRKKLLSPKTVMVTAVPLYADAMACVTPELRPGSREDMTYQWNAGNDFDETIDAADATDRDVSDVIEGVMGDVEDAVDYLCGVFARQYEDHYDYLMSDEAVWEDAEGCGDFGHEFVRHVTNN